MKTSIIVSFLLATSASSFTISNVNKSLQPISSTTTSTLNLFGGKKNDGGGQDKGPMGGMMDQLAMFKKAQEIAKMKGELDKELAAMDIIGVAADGKVKVTVKYVPAQLPVNPSPGYDAVGVEIDEDFLNETASADLGPAVVEALRDGETRATVAVGEKYKSLEAELASIMGGMGMGQ
mmetsp:Transcript_13372/g.19121  ORF Transcript_13372/g.19121 Transcript_13372/m.19121 type:complete len:178 (-) Transcript_13372:214-747(-)|eukprot:CAMPEP_0184854784 /NCGR_PEP_ID=MMETSP0580-20130426/187_1 /TAXON_ID=1118495 /ORGANISM="Dactyliosolen fragilissimus" /LENGTH=177 /DNA_ID=CAMNT_0027349119 /DNA_START=61 /DNA_END=594 /DNA_ORIENTATION=+